MSVYYRTIFQIVFDFWSRSFVFQWMIPWMWGIHVRSSLFAIYICKPIIHFLMKLIYLISIVFFISVLLNLLNSFEWFPDWTVVFLSSRLDCVWIIKICNSDVQKYCYLPYCEIDHVIALLNKFLALQNCCLFFEISISIILKKNYYPIHVSGLM